MLPSCSLPPELQPRLQHDRCCHGTQDYFLMITRLGAHVLASLEHLVPGTTGVRGAPLWQLGFPRKICKKDSGGGGSWKGMSRVWLISVKKCNLLDVHTILWGSYESKSVIFHLESQSTGGCLLGLTSLGITIFSSRFEDGQKAGCPQGVKEKQFTSV